MCVPCRIWDISILKMICCWTEIKISLESCILFGNHTREGSRTFQGSQEHLRGESGKASRRRWYLSRALMGWLGLDSPRECWVLQRRAVAIVCLGQAPIASAKTSPREADRWELNVGWSPHSWGHKSFSSQGGSVPLLGTYGYTLHHH